jgi:outer membrane biogenesis lipoprotein LolB
VRPFAALALVALLASGCAEFPWFTGARDGSASSSAFEMLGRVYARYGERAFSGSLRWQHARELDEAWLGGPLGQTLAYIRRDGSGASMVSADQREYHALSLNALTREGLGFAFPLADLSHYVLNEVPTTMKVPPERDSFGRLVRAQHDGWQVHFFYREGAAASAPALRIELRQADVEIRLVIDQLEKIAN